jgi:hypothetical protein
MSYSDIMADSSIDWASISSTLNSYHVPEIFLAVVGIVAILIVYTYLKDKDGSYYKLMTLIGVIAGVAMVALCLTSSLKTSTGTTIIVAVTCFALIIRPFRDVHFSLIIALLVMVVAYVLLGSLTGDLAVLATGWYRIGVAFLAGAIVYMLLGFLQALVQLFGKLLNAWPLLLILGVICITEAACVYFGYGSVYDMIMAYINGTKTQILVSLL